MAGNIEYSDSGGWPYDSYSIVAFIFSGTNAWLRFIYKAHRELEERDIEESERAVVGSDVESLKLGHKNYLDGSI